MELGEKIIVADDESRITSLVGDFLSAAGYKPVLASDGAEALAAFSENRDAAAVIPEVGVNLLHGMLHGNHNVAEHLRAGVVVDVVHAVDAQRKGQHIRALVYVAVVAVERADLLVVDERHADLRCAFKLFARQHRVAAAADEHADARRDLYFLLIVCDNDSDLFHMSKSFR